MGKSITLTYNIIILMGNIVIVARVLPHSPITFKLIAIAYANLIEYASASILLSKYGLEHQIHCNPFMSCSPHAPLPQPDDTHCARLISEFRDSGNF